MQGRRQHQWFRDLATLMVRPRRTSRIRPRPKGQGMMEHGVGMQAAAKSSPDPTTCRAWGAEQRGKPSHESCRAHTPRTPIQKG